MAFVDRSLRCRECGNAFTWTAGEQEFYQSKGLLHDPQRCSDCRTKAKVERAAQRAASMHDIICSNCGQPGQVPFAPRTDRPVYCSTCFDQRKPAPATNPPPPATTTEPPPPATTTEPPPPATEPPPHHPSPESPTP